MALRRLRDRLNRHVQPGEGPALLWSFLAFFCLLASYFLLRPMRDARGVGLGSQWLPALYGGTLGTLLAVTPAWGALVDRVPRARLLPWAWRFFALHLVVFFVLFRTTSHWLPPAAFFVWVSVFNVLTVATFWAFMTDVWRSDQGTRLFGLVAAGGSAGAILGPTLAVTLVNLLGPESLLLVAAALLELATFCLKKISRAAAGARAAGVPPGERSQPPSTASPASSESPGKDEVKGGVWAGLSAIVRSPFLATAAAYMLLGTLSATFNYNLQARLVGAEGLDQAGMTRLFAGLDLATNSLTAIFQGLVAAALLTRFGVGPALLALPLLSGLGFAGAAVVPMLALVAATTVLRRSTYNGLVVPGYGVLFTQVSREDRYKARVVIDTLIWRTGDFAGSLLFAGLVALGLQLRGVAAVSALVALPWLWLAWRLARGPKGTSRWKGTPK